jgi:parvulin-like peptidyl-prolyl isomerase
MGMMARMRSLAPWFIISVGVLFVLFMVLSDANITQIFRQQRQVIGSVDGKEITYQEFAKRVEFERNNLERQGRKIDESQMADFRQQVWDAMVNEILIEKKMKEYGIEVSDQEVVDALLGPNPPQFVQQYFLDSNGVFNRELYDAALRDPKNKEAVLQLEEMVRNNIRQQKLTDYLFAAVQVSEDEIKDKFIQDNITMSAEYALFSFTTVPDSMIKFNDDYARQYYDKHKNDYKQEETRKIEYVLFELKPSKSDTSDIIENLAAIVNKMKKEKADFKTYAEIYTDENHPYSRDTVSITKIDPEVQDLIIKAKDGDIIGPVLTRSGAVVYHLVKKIKTKEPVVRASHILVRSLGKGVQDMAAKKEAYDIYNQLRKGADFAEMAKEKSKDPGSAARGGDLGWFGKGQMVKEFEKAAFSGKVGKVLKPIKTRFGYHIIKVTDKLYDDFVIEKIVNEIKPSATTQDRIYNKANDFSYLAKKNDFVKEADLMKYKIVKSGAFTKETRTVAGLGSSRSIVDFTFANKVGTVSDVFKVAKGYVVFRVSEITPKGYKPFEKVKASVNNAARRELKLEKAYELAKEARMKIGTSGNLELAKEVWPNVKVAKISNVKLGKVLPVLGREFAFSEYCYIGKLNEVSDPVKGNRGVFLIKVTQRTPFDQNAYDIQRTSVLEDLMRTKQRQFLGEWLKSIKEEAKIVDERYKFYR